MRDANTIAMTFRHDFTQVGPGYYLLDQGPWSRRAYRFTEAEKIVYEKIPTLRGRLKMIEQKKVKGQYIMKAIVHLNGSTHA